MPPSKKSSHRADIVFNGIHAETGGYVYQSASFVALAEIAANAVRARDKGAPDHLEELKARKRKLNTPHYAPVEGVDDSARRSSVEGLLEPPDSAPAPGTQAEAHAKSALRSRGEPAKPQHELRAPAFTGLHTADQVYVEYKNGERELYDLRLDPHQLNNVVASTSRAELAQLQRWLVQLRTCVGQTCREAEDAPPPPAPPEH